MNDQESSSRAGNAYLGLLRGLFLRLRLIFREWELFLGITLTAVGLLGISSARYCDGSLSDYLSCTRPATYYFYDTTHTVLVIGGLLLLSVWYLRRSR